MSKHTHAVVGKDGKVKYTGTELFCKRKMHGYDRVEPLSFKKLPVAEEKIKVEREHTHAVIGKKGEVKCTGTELHCKRKMHGYDRVEPIAAITKTKKK